MSKREEKDRDVKKFLGMPMRWNQDKIFKDVWNPEEDRILPPKQFGVGWGLNVHALLKILKILK